MTAEIIPFPLVSRIELVARQAQHMACRSAAESEKYLRRQLDVQRQAFGRKGVVPARIETEVASYEGAIRAALWRLVMQGGHGGGAA